METIRSKLGNLYELTSTHREHETFRSRPFGQREVNHEVWMDQNNPQGWTSEQWRRFKDRLETHGPYYQEVMRLRKLRVEWVDNKMLAHAGRRMSYTLRGQLRREYNRDAYLEYPNPDPLTWNMPRESK